MNVQLELELPPGGWAGRELTFRDGVRLRLVASRADGPGIEARVVESWAHCCRRAGRAELGFARHPAFKEDCNAVLRIDETSGTLVAPQASGLVQESPPDREELLSLVTASWDAFAGELGLEGVRLLAREPVPYVDLLGLDERANRVVVILVTGDTVEWQLGRALGAAADVASWDRDRLLSVHTELDSVDGHESPALVLVAGGYDPRALATIDWLASRHEVPVSAYSVAMVRFGVRAPAVRAPRARRRGDARAARSTGCSRAAPPGPNLRKESEYVRLDAARRLR